MVFIWIFEEKRVLVEFTSKLVANKDSQCNIVSSGVRLENQPCDCEKV